MDGSNLALKYNGLTGEYTDLVADEPQTYAALADPTGMSTCICTCDMDGDGEEEIFLHNHNPVYTHDHLRVPDRLITQVDADGFVDLLSLPENEAVARSHGYGGRAAACIDSNGDGRYEIVVATFSDSGEGLYRLLSLQNTTLSSTIIVSASNTGTTALIRDGRGILVGPMTGHDSHSDLFLTNDNSLVEGSSRHRHDGSNVLLHNNADGSFTNKAEQYGVQDRDGHGRGALLADVNGDGILDLIVSNWLGPTRVYVSTENGTHDKKVDGELLCESSATNIFIAGDFNNDANIDMVKTDHGHSTDGGNTVLTMTETDGAAMIYPQITNALRSLDIKGAAVADLNGDGIVELYVTHTSAQHAHTPVSAFQENTTDDAYNWIRFFPLTKHGAPARGAMVSLVLDDASVRRAVIGGDCSYMCQSEPIAHFGLANQRARRLVVSWPGGHTVTKFLTDADANSILVVFYSGIVEHVPNMFKMDAGTTSAGVKNVINVNCMLVVIVFMGTESANSKC